MPEQSQQQAQSASTSQELRQLLLDQLEANKKAIEELNDAEVEAVAGGFIIAGGPYGRMPSEEMAPIPTTAALGSTAMPGHKISTVQGNPLTEPALHPTVPPPMTPMESGIHPIV